MPNTLVLILVLLALAALVWAVAGRRSAPAAPAADEGAGTAPDTRVAPSPDVVAGGPEEAGEAAGSPTLEAADPRSSVFEPLPTGDARGTTAAEGAVDAGTSDTEEADMFGWGKKDRGDEVVEGAVEDGAAPDEGAVAAPGNDYQPRRGAGLAADEAPERGRDEGAHAGEDVGQPSWSTSVHDADRTVGEERGDALRPTFDDDVTTTAAADAPAEAGEGAFDADHADGGDDLGTEEGSRDEEGSAPEAAAAAPNAEEEPAPAGESAQAGESAPAAEELAAGRMDAEGAAQPTPEPVEDAVPDEQPEASESADSADSAASGDDVDELRQPGDWVAGEDGPEVQTKEDADAMHVGGTRLEDGTLVPDTELAAHASAQESSGDRDEPVEGFEDQEAAAQWSGEHQPAGQPGGEQAGDYEYDQAHGEDGGWTRRVSEVEEIRDGGYGVGSAAPFEDGAMPLGHPVKAWRDTMTYVDEAHPHYGDAEPHVWFASSEAAEQAGFRRVD